MRRTFFALLLATTPAAVQSQTEHASGPQSLPREIRREAIERWNGAAAARAVGDLTVQAGEDVRGNVVVQRGPLTIAGHVTGDVIAINSDVILRPTARIDGGLLV